MSPWLLWLLGLLTVGLPVTAVLLWERIAGRPVQRTLARWGLVMASQAAAVLLVAAAVNDYGYFYGSWSELSAALSRGVGGAPPARVTVHGALGGAPVPVATAGYVRARTYPGFSTPGQWRLQGHLETVRIKGAVTRLAAPAFVYLPPEYYQQPYAHHRFRAVLVLTGYPGTDRNLVARLKYQDALLRDVRRHEARPMVLVMLQPAVMFPRDTECTDVPGGPQVATFLTQDVPSEISRRYRVPASGWGVVGNSTGGYCAAKLSMTDPTMFPAAASLSGYYRTLQDNATGDLWGGSTVVRDMNSPEWRLAHLPAPPVSMLVTCSRDERDILGLPDMRHFLRLVRPPMHVTAVVLPRGGHTFTTWTPQLPVVLHWLSSHLSGPRRHP